jgi:putative endonuclease
MYCTYILYSAKCDRYYIGYTSDIDARLILHNEGKVTATKNCRPYILKATKSFAAEMEARKEELRLKKMKSRVYLESLITGNW